MVLAALVVALSPLGGCDRDAKDGARRAVVEMEVDDSELPRPADVALPAGVTRAMMTEGRKEFAATCVVCHGPDARGTQLGPSLREGDWIGISGSYDDIVQVIREGVPRPARYPVPMPPGGGGDYSDEQVREIAAYVYGLGVGKGRPAPADTARAD